MSKSSQKCPTCKKRITGRPRKFCSWRCYAKTQAKAWGKTPAEIDKAAEHIQHVHDLLRKARQGTLAETDKAAQLAAEKHQSRSRALTKVSRSR